MAKNIAVTASAALPPSARMAVPVLTANGSSPTAKPVSGSAAEAGPLPNVEWYAEPTEEVTESTAPVIVSVMEQPAKSAANGKARKDEGAGEPRASWDHIDPLRRRDFAAWAG